MSDIEKMEPGQVVDYIEEYNDMHDLDLNDEKHRRDKGGKEKPTKRKATQADWDAFWG